MSASSENRHIAERLLEAARLLDSHGASAYRASAYRAAGNAIARHPYDVRGVFEREGLKGLDGIPHVGLGIASAIAEMLVTQRWTQLERLRREADPGTLLRTVPGLGDCLARRVRDELHVTSLEALEMAVHDGRLAQLRGVGPRRAAAVGQALEQMLHHIRRHPAERAPAVELLLEVDRQYRERAPAVLHAKRGGWQFTARLSNTALARRMGRARDWVVIHYCDGDHVERHCTVVTEPRGPNRGLRVVRGREDECLQFHQGRIELEDRTQDGWWPARAAPAGGAHAQLPRRP